MNQQPDEQLHPARDDGAQAISSGLSIRPLWGFQEIFSFTLIYIPSLILFFACDICSPYAHMTEAGRNLEGGLRVTADRSPTGTDRLRRWGDGASPFRGSLEKICPPREIIKEMMKGRQGCLGIATYRRVKNKSVSGIWSPKRPS